jgi:hypothetical protein
LLRYNDFRNLLGLFRFLFNQVFHNGLFQGLAIWNRMVIRFRHNSHIHDRFIIVVG